MSRTTMLVAPVAGVVAAVSVQVGDAVAEGDPVVILQSMKMEIPITAGSAGRVVEILVEEGQEVERGAELARIGAS